MSSWRVNIENTRDKWHLPLERDKAGSRREDSSQREVESALRKAGMMIQPTETGPAGWLRGRSEGERVDMNNRSSRDVDLRD